MEEHYDDTTVPGHNILVSLPCEIVLLIQEQLDLPSFYRCRAVCQAWRTRFSDTESIKLIARRHETHQPEDSCQQSLLAQLQVSSPEDCSAILLAQDRFIQSHLQGRPQIRLTPLSAPLAEVAEEDRYLGYGHVMPKLHGSHLVYSVDGRGLHLIDLAKGQDTTIRDTEILTAAILTGTHLVYATEQGLTAYVLENCFEVKPEPAWMESCPSGPSELLDMHGIGTHLATLRFNEQSEISGSLVLEIINMQTNDRITRDFPPPKKPAFNTVPPDHNITATFGIRLLSTTVCLVLVVKYPMVAIPNNRGQVTVIHADLQRATEIRQTFRLHSFSSSRQACPPSEWHHMRIHPTGSRHELIVQIGQNRRTGDLGDTCLYGVFQADTKGLYAVDEAKGKGLHLNAAIWKGIIYADLPVFNQLSCTQARHAHTGRHEISRLFDTANEALQAKDYRRILVNDSFLIQFWTNLRSDWASSSKRMFLAYSFHSHPDGQAIVCDPENPAVEQVWTRLSRS